VVTLAQSTMIGSINYVNPSRTTRTDDRGRYTFENLAAGAYIAAIFPSRSPVLNGVTPTFFPAASSASEAVLRLIRSGGRFSYAA